MKKLSCFAISALMFSISSARAQSTFSDVPDNHWAAAAVKRLTDAGIAVGRPTSANVINTESVMKDASDALSVVVAVKTRLAAEIYLQGSIIDVTTFTSRREKIVLLNGSVATKAQKSFAGYIAADTAPKYRIINHLLVNPKENQQ